DAAETVALLLARYPNYEAGFNMPLRFRKLVTRIKLSLRANVVTSVSKSSEDIGLAPATVIVLTGEQLRERGYTDLEQVLHDLPGFDLTTGNGDLYVNVYPRGYRNDFNDTMLLRFDGVEQNDLFTNSYYLSRQYPVAAVQSMTIVYGPASSLYGPNAYMGVIDVVTRNTAQEDGDGAIAAEISVAGGDLETRYVDLNLSGAHPSQGFTWSLIGRWYRSDETDLFQTFFPQIFGFDHLLENYHDQTRDQFTQLSLTMGRLTVGWQNWERDEGSAGWFSPWLISEAGEFLDEPRSVNTRDNRWTPAQNTLFAEYNRALSASLQLQLLSRYKEHTIEEDKSTSFLDFGDRENGESLLSFSSWRNYTTQFRNELNLTWVPNRALSTVMGVELRNTRLPAGIEHKDLLLEDSFFDLVQPEAFVMVNQTDFRERDLGAYLQATYRRSDSIWVAGGRFDHGDSRNSDIDFGDNFSPRLAWIYRPIDSLTLKLIYVRSFLNPSLGEIILVEKFYDEFPQINTDPSKLENLEFSAGFRLGNLNLDISAFRLENGDISYLSDGDDDEDKEPDVVEFDYTIQGVQVDADWRRDSWKVFGNLSFQDSESTEDQDQITRKTADIADFRLNLGLHWTPRPGVGANLRLNYVGERDRGPGTTVPEPEFFEYVPFVEDFPFEEPFTVNEDIPSYTSLQATISANLLPEGRRWGELEVQLIARNLLDEEIIHPGVREADGFFLSTEIAQPGRTIFLRLNYRIP
nr:TonB-dependent receptor plug domain-containing protein [Acidobacteriota bacterium]